MSEEVRFTERGVSIVEGVPDKNVCQCGHFQSFHDKHDNYHCGGRVPQEVNLSGRRVIIDTSCTCRRFISKVPPEPPFGFWLRIKILFTGRI